MLNFTLIFMTFVTFDMLFIDWIKIIIIIIFSFMAEKSPVLLGENPP